MSTKQGSDAMDLLADELQKTKDQLEAFLNHSTVVFIVSDTEGRVLRVNPTFESVFGWTTEEATGQILPLVPHEREAEFVQLLKEHHYELSTRETMRRRKDGSMFVASETITPIGDANGQVVGYTRMLRDVSEHKTAERNLILSEERYKSLFDHHPDAIFSLDLNACFTSMNPATERITGYTPDDLLGTGFDTVVYEGDHAEGLVRFQLALMGEPQNFEQRIYHKAGHVVQLNVITVPIKIEGEIVGVYGISKDITEQKRVEAMINYMAYHDALTDLPNRRLFQDRLNEALEQARCTDSSLGVILIDMDRFKIINDSLGHAVGDLVLQSVAERLKGCVNEQDLVARMGGDEFTLLLPTVKSSEEAVRVARRILDKFKEPMQIGGHEFHITPSIGIALFPEDGHDVETLLKHADTAMYRVKEHGKNNFQVYASCMNTEAYQRMTIDMELRKAVERQEFELHYQPQVNVSTGEIVGVEALIRWQHPERGLLYPGAFIPVAEETGLIVPMGEWVLRTACQQLKRWQEAGYQQMRIGVNLSLSQFKQQDLVERVASILQETGLEPKYLELEITESTAMSNTDFVIAQLNALVALGVQISIDDFGTGFSSLSYLKIFPIHKLKIDRSFIVDITNQSDSSIVSAIVTLARSLNLNVIVEGVETETQREYLPKLGCDEMQGYLFSTPLPSDQFEALLQGGWKK